MVNPVINTIDKYNTQASTLHPRVRCCLVGCGELHKIRYGFVHPFKKMAR